MADDEARQLGRLAGLFFDRAAAGWYAALGIEALSGLISAALALLDPTGGWAVFGTLVVVLLLVGAYAKRLLADDSHDTAQTMRRQAALTEGLGWRIERVQLEEWRRKAGVRLLRRVAAEPRAADYYTSDHGLGPRRMAEMTLESAFYTRHLWLAIRSMLIIGLVLAGLVVTLVVYLALSDPQSAALDAVVAHVVATLVPIAIALDVIGWLLRLTRKSSAIRDVEAGLDRVLASGNIDTTAVLRLVVEYDCELVDSIPIHSRIFAWKHDEIRELWEHRARDLSSTGAV